MRAITILAVFALTAFAAAQADDAAQNRLASLLAAQALPLREPRDLDPLIEAIGERRLVLLGEASHGTREYYLWRTAITQRLIEEKGFRILAFEADWSAMRALDRYVRHAPDAPTSARNALLSFDRWPRWTWANQETEALMEWLRKLNRGRAPEQRVGVYGMDIYGVHESVREASYFLSQLDPPAARAMREALGCFADYIGRPRAYLAAVGSGRGCELEIAAQIQRLHARREQYRARDALAWLHAEQNATVIRSAEQHYRTMAQADSSSWNARARHFYDTLARLREHYGADSRVVAWAHNSHVGDLRATDVSPDQENLGRNAREALGAQRTFIVGFGSGRGSVIASRARQGPAETMAMPAGTQGSLEDLLHRIGSPGLLFLMDRLRGIEALGAPIPHRGIGAVYQPEDERARNYVPTRWRERYDAFVYLEETQALRLLHPDGS